MNVTTTVAGDSSTGDTTVGSTSHILGLSFAISLLIITLAYASYKCQHTVRRSSPPPDATLDHHHHQLTTVRTTGIDDDVLMTFPAFVFSEEMVSDTKLAGSGCAICLAEYKPADVVRLLPECGHLFHCKCIDTWLKVHPTCPVCRNSPVPVRSLSIQRS